MKMSSLARAWALAGLAGGAACAGAAPITTLFSTGLSATGTALAGGSNDAHYTVVSTGNAAVVVNSPLPGTYFPNNASSEWVWAQGNGQPINTTLTFRTTFDLTGLDPLTALISGLWGTDNTGLDILINGVSTGISLPGSPISNFQTLHSFSISSGFVAGINTLDFRVQDVGSVGAFRAQLSGTADVIRGVPEPATLAIVGLGLAALGLSRRRSAAA